MAENYCEIVFAFSGLGQGRQRGIGRTHSSLSRGKKSRGLRGVALDGGNEADGCGAGVRAVAASGDGLLSRTSVDSTVSEHVLRAAASTYRVRHYSRKSGK